jgi:hypothetical protein
MKARQHVTVCLGQKRSAHTIWQIQVDLWQMRTLRFLWFRIRFQCNWCHGFAAGKAISTLNSQSQACHNCQTNSLHIGQCSSPSIWTRDSHGQARIQHYWETGSSVQKATIQKSHFQSTISWKTTVSQDISDLATNCANHGIVWIASITCNGSECFCESGQLLTRRDLNWTRYWWHPCIWWLTWFLTSSRRGWTRVIHILQKRELYAVLSDVRHQLIVRVEGSVCPCVCPMREGRTALSHLRIFLVTCPTAPHRRLRARNMRRQQLGEVAENNTMMRNSTTLGMLWLKKACAIDGSPRCQLVCRNSIMSHRWKSQVTSSGRART